jgi:hypothetical protein
MERMAHYECHWDVTETKEFLEGIRTGQEEVLKRLFSIPSNTQGYLL